MTQRSWGVLFQRAGRTVSTSREEQTIVNPGDLLIWDSRRSLRFDMPEYFQKVCLLIPLETFERVLPGAESYVGTQLQHHLNVSRLLGSCLSTLADCVLTNEAGPANTALEATLELLGATLTRRRESSDTGPRTNLFQRITAAIDKRLGDSELSPNMLARMHHISTRYLHLVFSERGTTVGAWIRSRRLAQCRSELANSSSDRTITEISMRWGFNDAAHFSCSFRSAYGVSPLKFRLGRRALNR